MMALEMKNPGFQLTDEIKSKILEDAGATTLSARGIAGAVNGIVVDSAETQRERLQKIDWESVLISGGIRGWQRSTGDMIDAWIIANTQDVVVLGGR